MANEKNLKPQNKRTKSEQREIAQKGGIASGKARRERKTFREELLLLLSEGNTQNKISVAVIEKAKNGDTKALEVILDIIGEKGKQEIEANVNNTITIKMADEMKEWGN